ncbi:MAG: RNA polymerase sigma factor (sigma-70 family) [Polaribacter sp.]|jgi:RNA polymerase sigma factor (sigma-70 family)
MRNKLEGSFEQILEKNKQKVYRICKVYAVNPIEPEDLFQEVIFQIWKSLDTFKSKSSIDTWVYKIAINVCLRSKMKFDKSNNCNQPSKSDSQKNISCCGILYPITKIAYDNLKKIGK